MFVGGEQSGADSYVGFHPSDERHYESFQDGKHGREVELRPQHLARDVRHDRRKKKDHHAFLVAVETEALRTRGKNQRPPSWFFFPSPLTSSGVQTDFKIAFWKIRTIVNSRKTHKKCSQMLQNGRQRPSGPLPTILQHLRAFLMGFTTIYDRSDFPKSDLKIGLDISTHQSPVQREERGRHGGEVEQVAKLVALDECCGQAYEEEAGRAHDGAPDPDLVLLAVKDPADQTRAHHRPIHAGFHNAEVPAVGKAERIGAKSAATGLKMVVWGKLWCEGVRVVGWPYSALGRAIEAGNGQKKGPKRPFLLALLEPGPKNFQKKSPKSGPNRPQPG